MIFFIKKKTYSERQLSSLPRGEYLKASFLVNHLMSVLSNLDMQYIQHQTYSTDCLLNAS